MTILVRISILTAMALMMGSCSGVTESSPADDQTSVGSTEKGATVQSNTVEVVKKPFSFTIRNHCTGGFIQVTGTSHTTTHTKERGDGTSQNRFSVNRVGHGSDAAGTKYTYKSKVIKTTLMGDPDNCPFTYIVVRRIQLNAPGKANNVVATVRFEVTTNCDGSFDIKHNVDDVTCQ